jgi:hypothetical protein
MSLDGRLQKLVKTPHQDAPTADRIAQRNFAHEDLGLLRCSSCDGRNAVGAILE